MAFITQTTDEQPQVLFISQVKHSSLLDEIMERPACKQLHLHHIPADRIVHDNHSSEQFYKIIVYLEDISEIFVKKELPRLLKWLDRQSLPTTFVTHITSSVEEVVEPFSSWTTQAHREYDVLSNCIEHPDSAVVAIQDWLHPQRIPLSFMLKDAAKHTLVVPDIEWYPLDTTQVCALLEPLLLTPRPEPLSLLRGKKITKNEIKNVIADLQRGSLNAPDIISLSTHPAVRLQVDSFTLYQPQNQINLEEMVKQFVSFSSSLSQSTEDHQKTPLKKLSPPSQAALSAQSTQIHPVSPAKTQSQLEDEPTITIEQPQSTPPDTVSDTLHAIFAKTRIDQKVGHIQTVTHDTLEIVQKNKRKKAIFSLGLLSFGIAFGVAVLVAFFMLSVSRLHHYLALTLNDVGSGDLAKQSSSLDSIQRWNLLVSRQSQAYSLILADQFFKEANDATSVADGVLAISTQLNDYSDLSATFLQKLLGNVPGESFSSISPLLLNSESLLKQVQRFQGEISSAGFLKTNTSKLLAPSLSKSAKQLASSQQILPVLDEILGKTSRKTYALVLQNEQELRPTGGFIHAVALVTFEKGLLIDLQVFDVYSLDQQFLGTVAAPPEIQRFLGEEKYYLRDSNWNPDFPTSARQMTFFIEKSLQKQVDGVMGITLPVLAELIAIQGPLELDQYSEVVTDRNLFERVEFHSEVQLSPTGERQGKDYLTALFEAVLQDTQRLTKEQSRGFPTLLFSAFESQQAVLYLEDQEAFSAIQSLGWAGEVTTPPCPAQFNATICDVDTIMQVEANVGINKANYHLSRSVSHSIQVSTQDITHQRVVTLKNESQTNAWPQGPYEHYTRFFLPSDVVLDSVLINGQPIAAANLRRGRDGDRIIIGVRGVVPSKQTQEITLNYHRPISFDPELAYVFFDQKQPGTGVDPYSIQIKHTPELQPTLIAPQADVSGSTIRFPLERTSHIFVGAEFTTE